MAIKKAAKKGDALAGVKSFHVSYIAVVFVIYFLMFMMTTWLHTIYHAASSPEGIRLEPMKDFKPLDSNITGITFKVVNASVRDHLSPFWFREGNKLDLDHLRHVIFLGYWISIMGLIHILSHSNSLRHLLKAQEIMYSHPIIAFFHIDSYQAQGRRLILTEGIAAIIAVLGGVHWDVIVPFYGILFGYFYFGLILVWRVYVINRTAGLYYQILQLAADFAPIPEKLQLQMTEDEKADAIRKEIEFEFGGKRVVYETV